MSEEWKNIDGWGGKYQISNLGRVKVLARVDSRGRNKLPEKVMHPNVEKGYFRVCFTDKDGIERKKFVHRLLAQAFIPNPLGLKQVNHKNGVRNDNSLDNLEWVSARENVSHGFTRNPRTSRLTGVYKDKQRTPRHTKLWMARIYINGTQIRIGSFYTEEDAHEAYKKMLTENGLSNRYLSA